MQTLQQATLSGKYQMSQPLQAKLTATKHRLLITPQAQVRLQIRAQIEDLDHSYPVRWVVADLRITMAMDILTTTVKARTTTRARATTRIIQVLRIPQKGKPWQITWVTNK